MAKQKYRTDNRDSVPPAPPPKPEAKPGTIKPGRLGVYDSKGRLRGQVGPKATAATASRFHKQLGSKLGTVDGRPAWIAPTLAEVSAKGSATPGATGDTLADVSSRGSTATKIATRG